MSTIEVQHIVCSIGLLLTMRKVQVFYKQLNFWLQARIVEGKFLNSIKVVVPVTSLCPCSKKISEYGAHNQRSHVTVTTTTNDFIWIEDIIQIVEKQASSELYGLLKRPDEKFVTAACLQCRPASERFRHC